MKRRGSSAWRIATSSFATANPRIEVLTRSNPSLVPAVEGGDGKAPKRADQIRIISMTIQAGEDLVVGKRLRDILLAARKRSG